MVAMLSVTYICWGWEICPRTQKPHLQGYLEMKNKTWGNAVKALFLNEEVHLEASRIGGEGNRNYCLKLRNGDLPNAIWEEWGEMMADKGGKRKESEILNRMLSEGYSKRRIAQEDPAIYCRYHRGISAWEVALSEREFPDRLIPRTFATTVLLYTGPTRCGKSRRAHTFDMATWTYPGLNWFDRYNGDEVCLFDDFRGGKDEIPVGSLFQICDRYPLNVRVKNGFVNWRPRVCVFTSNLSPDEWYPGTDMSPFWARVTLHIHWYKIGGNIGPSSYEMRVRKGEIPEGPYFEPSQ